MRLEGAPPNRTEATAGGQRCGKALKTPACHGLAVSMEPDRESRRRLGLILGGVGLVMLFRPALTYLLVPSSPGIAIIAVMVVGLVVLVAAFTLVPRRL